MKRLSLILAILVQGIVFSQESNLYEKYPVFPECADVSVDELEGCFNYTLQSFVFENFELPEIVSTENYRGSLSVLFEVEKTGSFKVIYVDAFYDELKEEVKNVFGKLPKITPATYNGKPAYVQFTLALNIPLEAPVKEEKEPEVTLGTQPDEVLLNKAVVFVK